MIPKHLILSAFLLLTFGNLVHSADKDDGKVKLSKEEQQILDLTNEARKEAKLPPLKPNPTLFKVARAHSANMAAKEEMNHVLDGKNPIDRIKESGYRYSWAGENIAYSSDLAFKEVFDGWMKSEGHRENILRKEYEEIGIGVALSAKKEVYYTQVFGSPRK